MLIFFGGVLRVFQQCWLFCELRGFQQLFNYIMTFPGYWSIYPDTNQSDVMLTPQPWALRRVAITTILKVFGMTWQGIESMTSYSRGGRSTPTPPWRSGIKETSVDLLSVVGYWRLGLSWVSIVHRCNNSTLGLTLSYIQTLSDASAADDSFCHNASTFLALIHAEF